MIFTEQYIVQSYKVTTAIMAINTECLSILN